MLNASYWQGQVHNGLLVAKHLWFVNPMSYSSLQQNASSQQSFSHLSPELHSNNHHSMLSPLQTPSGSFESLQNILPASSSPPTSTATASHNESGSLLPATVSTHVQSESSATKWALQYHINAGNAPAESAHASDNVGSSTTAMAAIWCSLAFTC
jgi:hypothetical protein